MAITCCGLNTQKPDPRIVCVAMKPEERTVLCGRCKVAKCCMAHGYSTCAECEEFPCDEMLAFSVHPEHPDGGARVEVLRAMQAR